MKTTEKHVGSVREWEGPIEDWEAHRLVIEHWCDGGDVQIILIGGAGNGDDYYRDVSGPEFTHDLVFCIKQREPKPGEVWVDEDGDAIHIPFDCEKWQFINKSGYKSHKYPITDIKYSAPSVEAYYARKFWNKVYGNEGILNQTMADEAAYKMSDIVEEAAQLEKQ